VSCPCDIVGLLKTSIPGLISASIDGNTTVEIADNGTVLLGSTTNRLSISAYAYTPGGNKFLGATCDVSAQVSVPWLIKEDCINNVVHFIPRAGATASITNRTESGILESIIKLECSPGISNTSISASASSGPTGRVSRTTREDGFGLVYTGVPLPINTASKLTYDINLGFLGSIKGHLQSFSLDVVPPQPATVSYTFAFNTIVA